MTLQALHPDGTQLVTGGRRGALHCWDLPAAPAAGPTPGDASAGGKHARARPPEKRCAAGSDAPATSAPKQALRMEGGSHGEAAVDGLLFLPGGRLVSKSADGRCFVWDFAARRRLASWKASRHSRQITQTSKGVNDR